MMRYIALAAVFVHGACAPNPRAVADSATATSQPTTRPAPAQPALAPTRSAIPETTSNAARTAGRPAPTAAQPRPKTAKPPLAMVGDIVDSAKWVGRTVRITGRCRGYGAAAAADPPPLSRSDWLLEDGGKSIYVNGPLPTGCTATAGSEPL
jgi:hypothetical protein